MLEAQRNERHVEDLKNLVSDGERNLVRMGDQLLINGRHRLDVERERKGEEDKVREISQSVQQQKNKVEEQRAHMRRFRQEEERLEREYHEKMDEAERFDREARELEEEAARLEREAKPTS